VPPTLRKAAFAFVVWIAAAAAGAQSLIAQDLGHKLPGLIGLDAGKVPEPGVYFVDRFVFYESDRLIDRNGDVIPVGQLKLQALANAAGVMYTVKLRKDSSAYFTTTVAAPLTRFSLNIADRPEIGFDRFGLADIFIQPVRLGWRKERADIVASYGLYLPTGEFAIAGGNSVSSGQVTHQFSAGGSLYSSKNREFFVTALGSYDLNLRKRNLDLTRGDTFQIQGGAGVTRLHGAVDAGVAGYALWQVRDDRGGDLPPVLRGARDRVYGLGPEASVFVRGIRSQIRVRYLWDVGVRSRPQGNILVAGINFVIHRPAGPGPAIP
jgi:hypothetical protein